MVTLIIIEARMKVWVHQKSMKPSQSDQYKDKLNNSQAYPDNPFEYSSTQKSHKIPQTNAKKETTNLTVHTHI